VTDGPAERLFAELARRPDPLADPELEALAVAILVEDALGVTLADEDLDRIRREGASAVAGLVRRKGGPA
jgi:hypothetical protein